MSTGIEPTAVHDYLARVDAIADVVRADAEQAEIDRRLGDKTVEALRESGLLRMLLPARYGGGGLHSATRSRSSRRCHG